LTRANLFNHYGTVKMKCM